MHSADGWHVVSEPVIARYRKRLYFRGDAAFANPEIEPSASATQSGCRPIASCSAGWDTYSSVLSDDRPHEVRRYFTSLSYQAQSWTKPRRVVAMVEMASGRALPARRLISPPTWRHRRKCRRFTKAA